MLTCPRCGNTTAQSPCVHCGARFAGDLAPTPIEGGDQATVSPGGYRIDAPLAGGGMGILMRGTRLRDGKKVVLKAPRDRAGQARERFHREARALATLNHQSVVRLLDIDCTPNGTPLLVLEHVPGHTLGSVLRQQRLSPSAFHCITKHIATALNHCHQRGIVHRDIKPDNIMVNGDGATLIDFGLALVDYRLHSPVADRLTPPGTALGTPPYAAPEQLRNPYATTVAADSYAFGMVIKDCLRRVDWQEHSAQQRHWQRLVLAMTRRQAKRRLLPGDLLHQWPSLELKPPRKRLFPAALIAASIGVVSALGLVAWSASQQVNHQQQLEGWLDGSGRETLTLALDRGENIEVTPRGDTRIRVLGGGAWTNGTIRLQGNSTGRVRLRIAAADLNWELSVSRNP